jgi:hypothetical protein
MPAGAPQCAETLELAVTCNRRFAGVSCTPPARRRRVLRLVFYFFLFGDRIKTKWRPTRRGID